MTKSLHEHDVETEHQLPTSDSEMIQYVGLRDLGEAERASVEEIATNAHDKIKRKVKNLTSLHVHVKCHGLVDGAEKEKKFSVHVRLHAPMQTLETDDADFDIRKATHKALERMIHQVDHKFRD